MPALDFLDGAAVRRWCAAAAEALGAARDQINALNVFPVADRDTGSNLHFTMLSAARALDELPPTAGQQDVWEALSHGVLLGAQGNSGIIVSQFLRGLAEVCAQASPCDGATVRRALVHAVQLSYAAVVQPVEGTVLTVAAAAAEAAAAGGDDLEAVARAAADGARQALARTTAQLDVLARAGVVDAGAAGLCVLLDTLAAVVAGTPEVTSVRVPQPSAHPPARPSGDQAGYEVMYLIEATDENVSRLREDLGVLGDSVVVVGAAGLWSVHVHAADAGAVIEAGMAAGRPHHIRITPLQDPGSHGPGPVSQDGATADPEPRSAGRQDRAVAGRSVVAGSASGSPARSGAGPAARADTGPAARAGHPVVAIAAADSLAALLAEAGAVVVRSPDGEASLSRELLSTVCEEGRSGRRVVILPGDSGHAEVAENVAAGVENDGIEVAVVPARTAAQSISALAVHDPGREFDEDVAAMTRAALGTRTGVVAWTAAGETAGHIGPGTAAAGGDPVVVGRHPVAVAVAVADRLLTTAARSMTLVSGSQAIPGAQTAQAPNGAEVAAEVRARITDTRPDLEVVSYDGGEPGYLLLIAVE